MLTFCWFLVILSSISLCRTLQDIKNRTLKKLAPGKLSVNNSQYSNIPLEHIKINKWGCGVNCQKQRKVLNRIKESRTFQGGKRDEKMEFSKSQFGKSFVKTKLFNDTFVTKVNQYESLTVNSFITTAKFESMTKGLIGKRHEKEKKNSTNNLNTPSGYNTTFTTSSMRLNTTIITRWRHSSKFQEATNLLHKSKDLPKSIYTYNDLNLIQKEVKEKSNIKETNYYVPRYRRFFEDLNLLL